MSTSDRHPNDGKQFELRATAVDSTLDGLLANFSKKEVRPALPGYLYLFSAQKYVHIVDDMYDGESRKERLLATYRRQVGDYSRNRFSLEPTATKERVAISSRPSSVVNVRLQLGAEVAQRVIAPPFFEGADDSTVGMRYEVVSPVGGRGATNALEALNDYLETHPRGIVDEFIVVESAFRNRGYAVRDRKRVIPKEPAESIESAEGAA